MILLGPLSPNSDADTLAVSESVGEGGLAFEERQEKEDRRLSERGTLGAMTVTAEGGKPVAGFLLSDLFTAYLPF
jgi:hypothetical protein